MALLLCDSTSTSLTSDSGAWCVWSEGDGQDNTVVTIYSSATGWFGFCIGSSSMANGDMVLGYLDSSSTLQINSYTSEGHAISLNSDPTWTSATPITAASAPAWANLVYTASRPNSKGKLTLSTTDSSYYMMSWSSKTPSDPNSVAEHDTFFSGTEPLEFSVVSVQTSATSGATATGGSGANSTSATASAAAGSSSPSTSADTPVVAAGGGSSPTSILKGMDTVTVNTIHGALMFVAWGVCPYVGIFIARFLKDALGVWWYRLHLGIMLVGVGGISVAALIFKALYMVPPHFVTTHQRMGLFVEVILVVQIVLGFVSNAMWSPTRTSIPWWDQAHWWLGRSVTFLSLVTMYLGFGDFNEATPTTPVSAGVIVLFFTWIGSCLVVLVAGQFRFGQVNHVAPADGGSSGGVGSSAKAAWSYDTMRPYSTADRPFGGDLQTQTLPYGAGGSNASGTTLRQPTPQQMMRSLERPPMAAAPYGDREPQYNTFRYKS
ncbi:hypothetical protein HK405_012169 [Cladochytrium tenue]|nr:hypothetical protein HK405_012169 [Cladochytrium tenue]